MRVVTVAALISGIAALGTLVQSQPLAAGVAAVLTAFFATRWWMIARKSAAKPSSGGTADSAAIRRLQPFEQGEGHLLSSRDEDVAALRTLVLARDFKFGMLYGDPNSGKTSVVRARLIPEVSPRKQAEYVDDLGTGASVLEEPLATGLRHALKLDDPPADLATLFSRLLTQPDQRVLMVWDNFDNFYRDVPDRWSASGLWLGCELCWTTPTARSGSSWWSQPISGSASRMIMGESSIGTWRRSTSSDGCRPRSPVKR